MVTADDVRRIASSLPRTTEALVHDCVKFRIGRIVYLALSRDESLLGFGFPKEERAGLVAAEPDKFVMPVPSDERYNWVRVRLAAIDETELRELVLDAWRMCVPMRVAAEFDAENPSTDSVSTDASPTDSSSVVIGRAATDARSARSGQSTLPRTRGVQGGSPITPGDPE
jgi:hypothetical protein